MVLPAQKRTREGKRPAGGDRWLTGLLVANKGVAGLLHEREKALDNVYTRGVIFVRFEEGVEMYSYTELVYISVFSAQPHNR